MTGTPKRRAAREALPPEPERHTEICNQIIDEMRVLSREEWFKIAKYGKPGVPGFSPMGQLQLKIRDNPLTFAPEITGIFPTPDGKLIQRVIPWPKPGWKLALKQIAKGWMPKVATDMYPYRSIDPIIDMLDRDIAEFGLEAPQTRWTANKLCELCLKDLNYGHSNQ